LSAIVAIFLFLHVFGAIVAFGPTFTFSLIAGLSSRYPQHGPFGIALSALIEDRIVLPMAVVQGITGLALVLTVPFDILASHWLALGIVLYLIELAFAFWVQRPAVERMAAITKPALAGGGPPPVGGAAPAAGATHAAGAAADPPAGPPPELAALGTRVRNGGFFMTAVLVAIVFLMVVKPVF
jgi:uncharacterized membrane protein